MATNRVTISAPARLHFGLFSVGDLVERKFGGIGLMIDQPRTVISVTENDRLLVTGEQAEACRQAVSIWFNSLAAELKRELSIQTVDQIPVGIEIESSPPRHCGFGTGTQMALSSAAAAGKFLGLPAQSPEEFASTLNRGKRSAIGTYGFCRGGFLVDRGKLDNEILAPLDFQTEFPEPWTVVLVRFNGSEQSSVGVSGEQEIDAFKNLPPTTQRQRDEMIELVKNRIIPGVTQRDYNLFGESVFEFGRRSGMMFDSIQGGPYQNDFVAEIVSRCREFGVKAVGQSSWGPCVFAIAEDKETAAGLLGHLKEQHGDKVAVEITKADNSGARFVKTN